MVNEVVLHIGSKTGYFFIGTKDEYYADIDQINNDYIKRIKATIYKYQTLFKPNDKPKPYEEWVSHRKYNDESEETKRIDYNSYLLKREKNKQCVVDNLPKQQNKLDHWIDIDDREVLDVYPRIQEDGIVVIVEGDEIEEYYYRQEYLKAKREKSLLEELKKIPAMNWSKE